MKTELKEISATQREIHIEIEPDALRDAYGKVSQKYARGASVPGFRKGYAPLDVVRLRYKDEIKNDVLQQVLPPAVTEAIQEHGLQPLAEPHLHIDDAENIKVNGTQPIGLHVRVEIMPEIPMPKYEGIEVTRRVRPVEESEVDELINLRLEQEAALIPIEGRASQTGDTVIADLEGTFADDPNGEPIRADDLEVKLGDEDIEKSFTENLAGVSPDEEKEFTVAYPEDFSASALAGKTVHYKARIKSVGRMETPELNDDWAKSLDEGYESLDDLRTKLRTDLETYATTEADAHVRNTAIAKLIDDNAFEVPSVLIDSQARNLLDNFARDLRLQGVDLDKVENDFLQMAYTQMRGQAERDVRGSLLLDKVADAERIEVKPDEVDEEIAKLANHFRSTPDEIRKTFERQGALRNIENNLRTRKTVEALVAKARITEGDWIDETAREPVVSQEKQGKTVKTDAGSEGGSEEKPKKSKTAQRESAG